jgi:hypothetical protein
MALRARRVTIPFVEPETDLVFSVTCSVTPGYPGGREEAPSGPEVEIDGVKDETGTDRPDMVSLLSSDYRDEIDEAAISSAADCDLSDFDDAQERGYRLRSVLADITGIPARRA